VLLFLSVIVAMLALFLAYNVQKVTHFIYPTDIFTIGLASVMILDLRYDVIPIWKGWYVAVIIGYIVGYRLGKRSNAVEVNTYSVDEEGDKVDNGVYHVFYRNKDGFTCRQMQTNRALLMRMLFSIHVVVTTTDGQPLTADWKEDRKYPWLPMVRGQRKVMVEYIDPAEIEPKRIWRFRIRQWQHHYTIAYGSAASTGEFLRDRSILDQQRVKIHDLEMRLFEAENSEPMKIIEAAIDSMRHISQKNHIIQLRKAAKESPSLEKKAEKRGMQKPAERTEDETNEQK
jgi:hypothetical protein